MRVQAIICLALMMLLPTMLLAVDKDVAAAISMADNDGNAPDTLLVERITAEKGAGVALKIQFFNDEELAALTIPLSVKGTGYSIDSVSFAGSRVEYLSMRPVTIKENKKEVVFGAIVMTEDYIPVGRGLMATLFLSPTGENSEPITIDTTTIGPATVLFTRTSSASFVPHFVSGEVSPEMASGDKAPESDTSGK
jgi:hypothetical protein